MNIGQYIAKARRSLGMSQAQFATELGVSQGSVSKWEASKESPRAEVVERIRQMSGIAEPSLTPTAATEEENSDAFDAFVEVPLKGRFIDGLSAEVFDGIKFKTLFLYLKGETEASVFEAWDVNGQYADLPGSFIGIFEMFSPEEVLRFRTAALRRLTVLVESTDADARMGLSIEEINGSDRNGWWLWPLDSRTKGRTLPVRLTADGMSESGLVRLRGILATVIYNPSLRRGYSF